MERLLEAGALDVTLEPVFMKKNRPGTKLSVLAEPAQIEQLASVVFAETSTLGIRIYQAERRVQARTITEVETSYGKVRVKHTPGGSYAPEFEDCRRWPIAKKVSSARRDGEASHNTERSVINPKTHMKRQVLSHDTYLLRQCGSAHRARVHHDCGRNHRASKTHAGVRSRTHKRHRRTRHQSGARREGAGQDARRNTSTSSPPSFRTQWKKLDLQIDRFQRTTDQNHARDGK